jgi:hypothetical protein
MSLFGVGNQEICETVWPVFSLEMKEHRSLTIEVRKFFSSMSNNSGQEPHCASTFRLRLEAAEIARTISGDVL